MRKEADFLTKHRQRTLGLKQMEKISVTDYGKEEFQLLAALLEAKESQFLKKRNDERYRVLTEVLYPLLYEIARIQGGHIILNVDEQEFIGTLTYIGDELILDNDMGLSDFIAIISSADDVSISMGDKGLEINLMFKLYDKVQVADCSEEISNIEEKIRQHRLKKAELQICHTEEQ